MSHLPLVLGANLGSAINPLVEGAAGENPSARRLPFGNLINRATGCMLFLPMLTFIDKIPSQYKTDIGHTIAQFHTLFNFVMAVIFIPLLPALSKLLQRTIAG